MNQVLARGLALLGLAVVLSLGGARAGFAQDAPVALTEPLVAIEVAGATAENADVFIDDLQANFFTTFEDGRLTVELPFTEATGPFRITVRDRATGAELFARTYRLGAPGVEAVRVFDTVDFEGSFQNDFVWKPTSERHPPGDSFDTTDVANDFRATGSFAATRDLWRLNVDGEIVGTDDDLKTIRPGKSKVDLANGIGSLAFDHDLLSTELSIVDLSMQGINELVSNGFGSRGFVFEASLFDGRLSLATGNTFGSDIIGTQRGVIAFDDANRRSAINADLAVLQSELIGLTLRGSVLDAVRPEAAGFNIGEVPDAEENSVVGTGFDLSLFNDRIVYSGNYGWSTYDTPDAFAAGDGNVGDSGDKAESHRVDAIVWDDGSLRVAAYGEYSLINPLYKSIESFVAADRETKEVGGSFGWGLAALSASYEEFENNVNDINSILTTRQATSSGDLSFDLDEFRYVEEDAGFAYVRALPSTVTLSASRTRIKSLNGDEVIANSSINGSEIPSQVTTTLGLGFLWYWDNASTSIDLLRSQLDTRQLGRDTADTDDKSIDLSHSVFGDIWDVSGNFAFIDTRNKEVATQSTDTRFETGLSFSYRPDWMPDLYASFDLSFLETRFDVDGTERENDSWRFSTSLDFTKYIPEIVEDYQPYAQVTYQMSDDNTRDPVIGKTSQSDYSVFLSLGFQF